MGRKNRRCVTIIKAFSPGCKVGKPAFIPGICVICGWHGIAGLVCKRPRCSRRYFYDQKWNIVHARPRCKVSKGQRALFEKVRKWSKGLETFQEVVFPWSIGPRRSGYRFDIVVPALKLIVEYDSVIHDKYIKHFFRTRTDWMAMQLRDQYKDKIAKKSGWHMIRVSEKEPGGSLNVRDYIERIRKERLP